jgi:cell wall-associated NlpC family hydrolase
VFTQAFALLEQPYGWGGRDGHRDCSSYLLDVFAQFDVRLPRNSAVQAQLGTQSVDLSQLDEASKTAAIRTARDQMEWMAGGARVRCAPLGRKGRASGRSATGSRETVGA